MENENMITISIYFEIHDADLYGGKGTVGYANTNVDLKVSALDTVLLGDYVESQRQGMSEMLKVDKEKVLVISRVDYENATEEEESHDYFGEEYD